MPGSEQGAQLAGFRLGDWLPPSEAAKIPANENPTITDNTYRNLPIDSAHGPFPVIFFIHGTSSVRMASYSTMDNWVSQGVIVVAADHPGLYLGDVIRQGCAAAGPVTGNEDLNADMNAEMSAVTSGNSGSGPMAFLRGAADMTRVGMAGHSQGAWTVAKMSTLPNVQLVLPLADTQPVSPSSTLKSVAIVAGTTDTVIPYNGGFGIANILSPGDDTSAYNNTPGPPSVRKRLVGINGGGHLVVTDLCQTNQFGRNAIQVAQMYGVCGLALIPSVFDCGSAGFDRVAGTRVVNDVTTAVVRETLLCQDETAWITGLRSRHPLVTDFHEAL